MACYIMVSRDLRRGSTLARVTLGLRFFQFHCSGYDDARNNSDVQLCCRRVPPHFAIGMGRRRSIVMAAAAVRVSVTALALLAGWLLPAYDRSGWSSLPLANWDAVFYADIARSGAYEFEQQFAFLPFLPFLLRVLSLGSTSTVVLAMVGVMLSNACAIAAAVGLYRLGQAVLQDDALAHRAALLYCFNPAGVFLSAAYTESLFSCCSFWALNLLYRDRAWRAACLMALAVATRTNGTLLVGFVFYRAIQESLSLNARPALKAWATAVAMAVVAVSPLAAFLAHGYRQFCPGPSPYCSSVAPNIYGFVQAKYWGVGLLRYWTLKQAPNFLLASPALSTTAAAILSFALSRRGYVQLLTAGVVKSPEQGTARGFHSTRVTCFIYHVAILLFTVAFVAHVQIATRFICSSSPVIYWYVADVGSRPKSFWPLRLYLVWFACYTCIGTILFARFLPWT
ncbi:unnamed protein product (mitochondrion) [Plasmodiophora brassicae]|uniref:GPI mannosyltransferase 2 n=1 Tax=Plasmodiophora brassicae TaxID=37360 RepID=A0A3P3YA55_PLABS|nr:unnamed protein product [Plasmodiophora brassicae]